MQVAQILDGERRAVGALREQLAIARVREDLSVPARIEADGAQRFPLFRHQLFRGDPREFQQRVGCTVIGVILDLVEEYRREVEGRAHFGVLQHGCAHPERLGRRARRVGVTVPYLHQVSSAARTRGATSIAFVA